MTTKSYFANPFLYQEENLQFVEGEDNSVLIQLITKPITRPYSGVAQTMIRSVSPYGSRKLYLLNGTKETSGFESGVSQILYSSTQSYSNETYDPTNFFLDSPTEEHVSPNPLTSSYESNIEPEYQLTENLEELSYNEDDIRLKLKLQELEHALLDDNDNSAPGRSMEIEPDWGYSVHESPKESSSYDSYVSSTSSNSRAQAETRARTRATTPKELLFECAIAVSEGNIDEASEMINELRQTVSIDGEPSQRILAYMVEALAARVAVSGKGLYKALKCKEPPSTDRLSAMQVLFEVCPCFRFGFMAANGAILEAFVGEKQVHIIDFDINQGSQYITLLQTLAGQNSKPRLRLTGVDDPESVQRPVGGLNHIGLRLQNLAESLNLEFEFTAVAADTAVIQPEMLNCSPGEAVIVNFAFQLHHMPDESVSVVNLRDQLLRMVKSLNPKLVTVVEQDVNTNTAPFLHRFHEAYNYYSAMFDCLDATLSRESQERVNVEKQCLARDIVNIIACEGEERIERYEVSGKWKARMMMAGFREFPISEHVNDSIRELIKMYSERYKTKVETNAIHFGWEDKVLIVASAWR
ncbi:hypothetical protein L2E82_26665 [Cichorium intybus]|uniref:Uncharacterized protein n=1 Tax=Cichorium intybus TaxID=13427 RepID=A0ACB9CR00_CICIN|nr:hypothetical protein L2E82_26665 [Cichorium intybus]